MNRKRKPVFAALAALLFASLSLVAIPRIVQFVREVIAIPSEAYASDWTAVFIIDHIRTSGTWPTGWGDLKDEFDRLAVPTHYAWTFDELQILIDVDWDATVSAIRDSDVPPQHVRLTSGSTVSYNGNPNTLIYNYITTGDDPHRIHRRIGG